MVTRVSFINKNAETWSGYWTRHDDRDFRLPPRYWWNLRSSGVLRGVVWQLFTDVSGQRIGHKTPRNNPEDHRFQFKNCNAVVVDAKRKQLKCLKQTIWTILILLIPCNILCFFQVLIPDDGRRPPKHVAGTIVRIYLTCSVRASSWFVNYKKYMESYTNN